MRYMLGKTEILDTSPTGQGVPVPVTQLSPQESAGQRGSRQCGPRDITALAPTLDRSLKSDRSLCPVRALRYYLDRTSGRIRWFLSPLRKVLTDISPATISSWIKQTVILCYELSDQEAHTLHQVKAHDVRAFDASKVFQSGVFSLVTVLSACH